VDPVLNGVARGQQENRNQALAGAQAAHDFEAVDSRKPDVQHEHRDFGALQIRIGIDAIVNHIDHHSMSAQGTRYAVGKNRIVFH
jgi:hypothetical protein